jgi:hypothetical protein
MGSRRPTAGNTLRELNFMPLSEDDRKELRETMAAGIAEGLALFRSKTEEEAAKLAAAKETETKPEKKGGTDDDGFSFAGFILGGK